jgi:protein-S-isoprenylcysteine O-methyltransferase Ste14
MRLIRALLGILLFFAVLFAPAGRLDWVEGWAFLLAFLAGAVAILIWGLLRAPDLMAERGKMKGDAKGWDRAILGAHTLLLIAVLVVAGLDARRFGWSSTPLILRVPAWLGLAAAFVLAWWSLASNPFASRSVRIQKERGHRVATSGPYRYVRHPMYVGVILCAFCIPILLGSWWALIPGTLWAMLFVGRTALEDRTLKKELEGYRKYAERVRYRLLPLVW